MEKYGTARQVTDDQEIRRMPFASRISKATDKHSEYEILTAFPQQQRLRECISVLRVYVRTMSLVMISVNNTTLYRKENGKNTLQISHDMFHFPLHNTSRYSPSAFFFPMRSHECYRCSHTKQLTCD